MKSQKDNLFSSFMSAFTMPTKEKQSAKRSTGKKTVRTSSKVKAKGAIKSPIKVKKTKAMAKAKKVPVTVTDERSFWVNNGPVLTNILDLRNALHDISDEQFYHHVREDMNDFALWVEHVLCEEKCAQALASARTRPDAVRVVETFVNIYI